MKVILADVDECATFNSLGNLCSNGATCVNTVGDYECKCANGWTGRNCKDSKYSFPTNLDERKTNAFFMKRMFQNKRV